jgi:hypothetical protein
MPVLYIILLFIDSSVVYMYYTYNDLNSNNTTLVTILFYSILFIFFFIFFVIFYFLFLSNSMLRFECVLWCGVLLCGVLCLVLWYGVILFYFILFDIDVLLLLLGSVVVLPCDVCLLCVLSRFIFYY